MLGLFKRKKHENPFKSILSTDNSTYAQFVKDLFENMDRGSRVHVLVAYKNLIPIVGAMQTITKQRGENFSLEEFIVDCLENQMAAKDEVSTRRYAWFLWAAMLYRVNGMCHDNENIRNILAMIWCDIARVSPLLKVLLPDNVVWKDEEKAWFDFVLNDHDKGLIAWTINHGSPRVIWKAPAIKCLAEEFDLFHFDGADTMGPLGYIPK